MKKIVYTCCLIVISTICAWGQRGSLDLSFSSDGKVTTDIGPNSVQDEVRAVAIQADGKIVVGGWSRQGNSNIFAICRYHPDGNLDSGFGGSGVITSKFISNEAHALVIQADGKILAGGRTSLLRYHIDGNLDTSFDKDRKILVGLGFDFFIRSLAIQPDGKILVAGGSGSDKAGMARFHPDGTIDSSFGYKGLVFSGMGGVKCQFNSIAIQPDGKIVGGVGQYHEVLGLFGFVRFKPDGSIDSSFGGVGKVNINFSVASYNVYNLTAIALQTDGKIVGTGWTKTDFQSNDIAVARLNPDGTLDNSFSNDGKIVAEVSGSASLARGIVITPDGEILVSGPGNTGSTTDFMVMAITPNGLIDSLYGNGGMMTTDIYSGSQDLGWAIALQPDGKIVVAGNAYHASTGYNFAVVRYHGSACNCVSTGYDTLQVTDTVHVTVTDTTYITLTDTSHLLVQVTDTLVIDAVLTGVHSPDNTTTIKVYPNPTRTHVVIDFGNFAAMNGYQVRILNAVGQLVYTSPVTRQQETVSLEGRSEPGIYIIQVLDAASNTIITRTIVLQ